MGTALHVLLEWTRLDDPQDPHAFRFEPQGYTMRTAGGGLERFDIPWTRELLADLAALRRPGRDPGVLQRVGDTLQRALRPAGWRDLGEQIHAASRSGRPVFVTLRSNAAELYALPWELLAVDGSGQHLGELPGVLLRHEWPATATTDENPSPRPAGGRVLVAWSAAGGAVPAAEHLRAVASAWTDGHVAFDPSADALAHVSAARLARALADAEQAGKPFAVLHLLAHGAGAGSSFGLALDGEDGAASVVDAGRLRQLLAPHAGTLRLVVLAACDGGNVGDPGNHLGSVAQALHRAGIQAVIASRYPLSIAGSTVLAETLYRALLVDLHSLERAFTSARARLARLTEHLDWASLQLYAHAADGDDTRPVVFSPYRGLLTFEPRHRRFFFGRDAERHETLRDMQALIDGDKPRFLIVVGASGTGKSSMVLAGVVPDVELLRARRPGPWEVSRMVPGAEPSASLDGLLATRAGDQRPLLLLVDQFEEIFTHTGEAAAREAFVRRLWSLSRTDSGVHVILTLRIDFLGHCGDLQVDDTDTRLDRVAFDEDHRVFVARMAEAHVRAAIEAPAARVGLALAPGLSEHILADVGAEPGALPLLQYALTRLWQHRHGRTLAAEVYEEIGGLVGALEKDADDLVDGLDAEQRRHARHLLTQLVDTSEDEAVDTRRRVEVKQLEPAEPGRRAAFEAVLGRLVETRLVVRSQDGATPTLEIAHEALIRHWGVLRRWIGEDRVMLAELEKLRQWTRDCEENRTLLTGARLDRAAEFIRVHGQDVEDPVQRLVQASEEERRRLASEHEAQRRRRRRTVTAVISALVVGVLGMTGLSFYALRQQARAEELLDISKGITKDLLIEVLPKYAGIPGTAEVQRELHERLKTMLGTLRSDAQDDADIVHLEIQQRISRGDLAMTYERREQAREEFNQALALAERFLAGHPDHVQTRRDLSGALDKLGDVDIQVGDLAAARGQYARALQVRETLTAADPSSALDQRGFSVSLERLGMVEEHVGNLDAARAHYDRVLELREALAAADPTSALAQRDLLLALMRLGDVEERAGDLAGARSYYDRALDVSEALAAADPTSALARRDLSVCLSKLGDVEMNAGDLAAAHGHYVRDLEVSETLAATDPSSAQAQRDLAVSLRKFGTVEERMGDLTAARGYYDRSLRVGEALAAVDPTNAELQQILFISSARLGRAEAQADDLDAARGHFARGLETCESLAAANPTSMQCKYDVPAILIDLGGVEARSGNLAAAREHYERARVLLNRLVTASPDDPDASFLYAELYIAFTDLDIKERRPDARREHAAVARAILDAMAARGQIAGNEKREAARERVLRELAGPGP